MEEKYMMQVNEVKDVVRRLINVDDVTTPLAKLELIDTIQRLGLKYRFESEIKQVLDRIYHQCKDSCFSDDLHATSLRFRLLRQNGYKVHQDVFESFKDETGNFRTSLCGDVDGMLSMYEASFLGWEDEPIIDDAKVFATANLKSIIASGDDQTSTLAIKIGHALDMPLHWRPTRIEARWFIQIYEHEQNMNPNLLRMAKLDYNLVQSIHQKEVAELVRWWMDTGLGEFKFARDRIVEHYFWCSGVTFEPNFGDFRVMGTKLSSFVATLDDIYDNYGFLDELKLFTDLVDRWDVNGFDKLPIAMRRCFLALFNASNDIGYWILKGQGFNIIPYLRKAWADMCKAYLQEAVWNHGEQKPTLQEYLENALLSSGVPFALLCAYFLTTDNISVEVLEHIDKFPRIIQCPSMIMRLSNDLASFSDEMARGESCQLVKCHMNETGASEKEARDYINGIVNETWKKLNKVILEEHRFPELFHSASLNLARMAQCVYQKGDGHSTSHTSTKDQILSLLIEPIPLYT